MSYGFLIDMDGVIYRGNDLIPGADKFIAELLRRNIPFIFLTNNSQRTRRDVALKLSRMGIDVEPHHIFTCAMAAARFVARQKPEGTAFVIGEGGLLYALHHNGYAIADHAPDYVIVGEGRTYNCEMIEKAVQMVMNGSRLISTNPDFNCPTPSGMRPGCGAIVSVIEKATGKRAFSLGKPSPIMMRDARKQLGLSARETVMIGDTMETDILGGLQMGCRTVLVLSGGARSADLDDYAYGPDLVVDSVADLLDSGMLDEHASVPFPAGMLSDEG